MGHGHAVFCPGTGQTDDMLGTDVRAENRSPDHPPTEISAGEKVVGRGVLGAADHPPGHTQQNAKINSNRYPIQRLQGMSRRLGSNRRISRQIEE